MKPNEQKELLSARYHPFHYLINRSGKELNPLMEEFLRLMETPDEQKMDKKSFRLSREDVELSGWDEVITDALSETYNDDITRIRMLPNVELIE